MFSTSTLNNSRIAVNSFLNDEVSGAFEIQNPSSINPSDQEEDEQVGIDENALCSMLLDQRCRIQHLGF
jgi:hypothetical protein